MSQVTGTLDVSKKGCRGISSRVISLQVLKEQVNAVADSGSSDSCRRVPQFAQSSAATALFAAECGLWTHLKSKLSLLFSIS